MDPRIIHLHDLQPEHLPYLMQPGEAGSIVRNALIYGDGDILDMDDFLREYIIRGKYEFYGVKSNHYRRDEIELLTKEVIEQLTEAQAYLLAPLADSGFTRLLLPPWHRNKNDGYWSLDIGTCFGASLEWFQHLLSTTIRRSTGLENLEKVLVTGENHLAWKLANPYGYQAAEELVDMPELPDIKLTPEPWPEPTYWVELKHELSFPDDQGQTEPAANIPYCLRLPDGTKINGTLDANGTARHSGIKPGTCHVEYEPGIDEEIQQLQAEIKTELDAVVKAEQAESANLETTLKESSPLEQSAIYTGAVMTGAKNIVTDMASLVGDTVAAAGEGLAAAGKHAGKYLLDPINAPKTFQQDLQTVKAGYQSLQDFANEDLETYWAITQDEESWTILNDFAGDYLSAQHSTEWAEAGGAAIPTIILAILSGGTGGAAGVGSAGARIAQVAKSIGPKLKQLLALLKRKRAKTNKSGPHDSQIKTVIPLKNPHKGLHNREELTPDVKNDSFKPVRQVDMDNLSETDADAALSLKAQGREDWQIKQVLESGNDLEVQKFETGDKLYGFTSTDFPKKANSPYWLDEAGYQDVRAKYFKQGHWDREGLKGYLALPCYNTAQALEQTTVLESQTVVKSTISKATEVLQYKGADGSTGFMGKVMGGGGTQISPTPSALGDIIQIGKGL